VSAGLYSVGTWNCPRALVLYHTSVGYALAQELP